MVGEARKGQESSGWDLSQGVYEWGILRNLALYLRMVWTVNMRALRKRP